MKTKDSKIQRMINSALALYFAVSFCETYEQFKLNEMIQAACGYYLIILNRKIKRENKSQMPNYIQNQFELITDLHTRALNGDKIDTQVVYYEASVKIPALIQALKEYAESLG